MRLLLIIIALLLFGLFKNCGEPQADLSMPKTYQAGSITFDYPKNWKVTDDLVTPAVHSLFVETPGDAIAIFQSYPIDDADDLTTYAKAFSMSTTKAPLVKMVQTSFTNAPAANDYEWIAEKFSITVLGETVPHQRLYGSKEMGERRVFLIFQVATEDYAKAEPGFELIRDSLRGIEEAEQDAGEQPPPRSE